MPPPSSLSISLSISFHTNTFMWLYLHRFSLRSLFNAALFLLLWGLTRLLPYFSLSVITEQSRRYRLEQQHFMKTIQYSLCEYVRRQGNVHLITSEICFPVGEGMKSHCAEITRSRKQRGVDNNDIVSEMTEVASLLSVCRPHRLRIKVCRIYLHQPFQKMEDEWHAILMIRLLVP